MIKFITEEKKEVLCELNVSEAGDLQFYLNGIPIFHISASSGKLILRNKDDECSKILKSFGIEMEDHYPHGGRGGLPESALNYISVLRQE